MICVCVYFMTGASKGSDEFGFLRTKNIGMIRVNLADLNTASAIQGKRLTVAQCP